MIQVFKTDEEYVKWLDGQRLPSGIVVYVSDDETMYFSTNNIKGELKTYKCEKEEPIIYPPLVYSTNAAGSTITVNGQSMTLEQGDNIELNYANEITSVNASSNSALTYIQIPNTVTSIESKAFYICTALASVNIPDTVTSIGDRAFYRCNKLSDFNYNGTMSQWASITLSSGWGDTSLMVVHCSDGYVLTKYGIPTNKVKFSTNAAGSTITVNGETVTLDKCINCALPYANEITSINATNNTALMMIKLPNTMTSIDNNSFANCISLNFIIISDSITSINENAFYGCTTLNDFIYSGTKAQWASITKGTNWNKDAAFTVVHCTDGDVTV